MHPPKQELEWAFQVQVVAGLEPGTEPVKQVLQDLYWVHPAGIQSPYFLVVAVFAGTQVAVEGFQKQPLSVQIAQLFNAGAEQTGHWAGVRAQYWLPKQVSAPSTHPPRLGSQRHLLSLVQDEHEVRDGQAVVSTGFTVESCRVGLSVPRARPAVKTGLMVLTTGAGQVPPLAMQVVGTSGW